MEPRLPSGYYLERDADLLLLRRHPSGELVAAFSARGVAKESVEGAAREDLAERSSPEAGEGPSQEGRGRSRHWRIIRRDLPLPWRPRRPG